VDKFALDAILSIASDEKNDGKIGAVSIKNETEKDIRNAKVLIAPTESDLRENNFHGFGLANSYGNDILNPIFEVKDEGIEVSLPLLEPGQGAIFWIAHEPPQGFKVFPLDDNLSVEEDLAWLVSEESGLDFAFVFLIGILCLVLGIWAGNAMIQTVIKKAGYDPKAIDAAYYQALANDKAREAKSGNESEDA
jgi:hypothetical protein